MKYLLVGLGNIGTEYILTRHNIGFMVLDHLAAAYGAKFEEKRLAAVAHYRHRGRQLYLIKPNTYMNNSGKAVRYWLQHLQVPLERSLVIVDDVALPFGKLRIRPQGSSAGHNGLKSIEAMVGSQAYPRLRMGIGQDFPKGRQADYVLAPFTAQEQVALPAHIDLACEVVQTFCVSGIEQTMAQYN
ncbi:MAG: aminoacyl-tRNA hydrolase [Bacteroidota bacterium]